jgi:transcription-repair coupling factor (superfamily II helicase)
MSAVVLPEAEKSASAARLHGAGDALALARLARASRPIVVFCEKASEAQRLKDEIAWFAPQLEGLLLPDWETLPYDHFSPHHDLVSERLATLYRIMREDFDVAIVPAATALTRLAPPSFLAAHSFFLKSGEALELGRLRAQLTLAGYSHVTQVVAPGEYCVRAGLVDRFPMESGLPDRLGLFDADIRLIRFRCRYQRTLYRSPSRPCPRAVSDGRSGATASAAASASFEGDPSKPHRKDMSNGVAPAIEYYCRYSRETATLFDYLPKSATLCMHGDVHAASPGSGATRKPPQAPRATCTALLPPAEFSSPAESFSAAKTRRGHGGGAASEQPLPELAWAARPIPCIA